MGDGSGGKLVRDKPYWEVKREDGQKGVRGNRRGRGV